MQAKYQQDFANMEQRMMTRIKERLVAQMEEQMQSYMHSFIQQQSTPPPHASTWGYVWPSHSLPHDTNTLSEKCQLLLDGFLDAVAIGTMQAGRFTEHHQTLHDDLVRVFVDEVIQPKASLLMSTAEFMTMGDTLHNYVQWPCRLIIPISSKDVPPSKKNDKAPIIVKKSNRTPVQKLRRFLEDLDQN
ncbi:hypothetical protein Fmac_009353 [Flemingia macrophylla]|uniref:DUF8039 domain-containing protein n=1 Tax=Flemingia macrophylla TaxID=520843 RepID=A0ABD1MZZ6_9FABA